MGAFFQRLLPLAPGNHPAQMRRVEEHVSPNFIGDLSHFANRVRCQIEAAGKRDQLGLNLLCQRAQSLKIDSVVFRIDRAHVDIQAIQSRCPRLVMVT